MTVMYFLILFLLAMTVSRRCRLRLPVLWLSKCFFPAWRRFNLPEAVTRKRFLLPLWVFILGMAVSGAGHFLIAVEQPRFLKRKGAPGQCHEVPNQFSQWSKQGL